ncbi:hypothetical protein CRE_28963 [Caenorhabditis remanei]|uniref:Uncharacterized protein n=1 Tax=Caenorhabditis remanei TaxID=31234 RepID=E3N582_CAERE|nr:hypothetical protein CRE_28963 [Caenorhabditis remanei]
MRISTLGTGRRCFSLLIRPPSVNSTFRAMSSGADAQKVEKQKEKEVFELDGRQYTPDSMYNLSPAVRRLLDRKILQESSNPLNLLKRRVVDYVHHTYRKPGTGNYGNKCLGGEK